MVDLVLLYDGTVKYFGTKHLPLSLAAIIVLIIFVLLPPVAMILYPFKCVQRCLTRCRLHRPALVAFMDAIQGCYKDGTNDTYDLRFCSAVYFLSRVVVFTMYAALAFEYYQQLQYCLLFIPLSLIVFVAVVRPYKKDLYNSLDITMFVFYIIIASSCLYSSNEAATKLDFKSVFTYSCSFLFQLCLLAHLSEPLYQLLCTGVWCSSWCPLIDWSVFEVILETLFTLQYTKIITSRSSAST